MSSQASYLVLQLIKDVILDDFLMAVAWMVSPFTVERVYSMSTNWTHNRRQL